MNKLSKLAIVLLSALMLFSCSDSPEPEVKSADFNVKASSRGLTITGLKGECPDGNLVIPAEIEGKKVVAIQDRAFSGNKEIKKVVIPETIEEIGDAILSGCLNLEQLEVLPGNIYFTSEGNCVVRVKDSMLILGCKNSIIPDTAKIIGQWAFNGVHGLKELRIGTGVEKILDGAFSGMSDLEKISFSASVKDIGSRIFSYCNSLNTITVDKANPVYRSENNCLVKESGSDKIVIAGCASSKIPAGTTEIARGAFNGLGALKSIDIPDTVKVIGHQAFSATGLKSIHIPASVTELEPKAFLGCRELETITVDAANTKFYAEGNCLIDRECKYSRLRNNRPANTLIQGCSTSVIPDGINEIYESAFAYIPVKSVVFPASLKIICERAFEHSGLEQMPVFPETILNVEPGAFAGLPFSDKIPSRYDWVWIERKIGDVSGYALSQYAGPLGNVEIPSEINGKPVILIRDRAFNSNEHVKSVSIPASVSVIESRALYGIPNLEAIKVADGNEKFHVVNDCLIEKSTGRLIKGLDNGQIPEGVKIIDESAFKERFNIRKIALPSTLERIEANGLDCLRGLTEPIVIPESVTYVGPNGCTRYGNSNVEIVVNNTEAYVKQNWDPEWCGERVDHITYAK